MFTLQDIPRIKAGTIKPLTISDDPFQKERSKLAIRAKDVLGYGALMADMSDSVQIDAEDLGKLTMALLQLDIPVLDTKSVIEYQLAEMTRLNREFILKDMKAWAADGWRSTMATWEKTEIKKYKEPIPEFVIDKAIRIKEALPEVKIFIQHVNQPKADPFLVVSYLDEIYYVEAWAEPKFEMGM